MYICIYVFIYVYTIRTNPLMPPAGVDMVQVHM